MCCPLLIKWEPDNPIRITCWINKPRIRSPHNEHSKVYTRMRCGAILWCDFHDAVMLRCCVFVSRWQPTRSKFTALACGCWRNDWNQSSFASSASLHRSPAVCQTAAVLKAFHVAHDMHTQFVFCLVSWNAQTTRNARTNERTKASRRQINRPENHLRVFSPAMSVDAVGCVYILTCNAHSAWDGSLILCARMSKKRRNM